MGNISSVGDGDVTSKIQPVIKLKDYQQINITIPYNQLQLIRVLQASFSYEVSGTIYVDKSYQFKGFEVRTDGDELFSPGASDWKISYHTHPDSTSRKYGLRYYSPPSVEDIMTILDHCHTYMPKTVSGSLGEISMIFTNEGIYLLQADRKKFMDQGYHHMSEDDIEDLLHKEMMPTLVQFVHSAMKKLDPLLDIENPNISAVQFIQILQELSQKISTEYPLRMNIYGWEQLERDGLTLEVNTYFVNKQVED